MIHLGDITKIKGNEAPVVDVIVGGSPCQDLSLAGKRAGLAGARSGLYMEQIRIIKEMREHDRINGRTGVDVRPRYNIWENVPGAFSTNGGKDFAAVLEEAIRVAEPQAPNVPVPEKGWPTAGCIIDELGKWSVAWRVMDAQFWGVPQRRRRICLVCDFNGLNAPKIVFGEAEHHRSTERDCGDPSVRYPGAEPRPQVQPLTQGLSGHPDESKPQGQEVAGDVGDGVDGAIPYTLKIRGGREGGGKGALIQTDKSATLSTLQDQTLFAPVPYGISPYHSNCMKSDNPHSGYYEADTSRSLDAVNCGYPGCNQGGMAVVQPLLLESNQNHATVQTDGISTTLPASMGMGGGYVPMVTQPICFLPGAASRLGGNVYENKTPTLLSSMGDNQMAVAQPTVCIEGNGSRPSHKGDGYIESDKMYTLNTTERHGVAYSINHQGGNVEQIIPDKTGTLTAATNSSGNNKLSVAYTYDARGNGDGDVACTITGGHQSSISDYTAIVMEPIAYNGANITSPINATNPQPGDPCHTLNTDARNYVVEPKLASGKDVTGCLMASGYDKLGAQEMFSGDYTIIETYAAQSYSEIKDNFNCVIQKVDNPWAMEVFHTSAYENISPPIKARDYKDPHIVAGVDARNATELPEQNITLQSSACHNLNSGNVVRVKHIVRRLTPLECERLQGYPDGWTDIGEWVDSKGKKHKEADSPRYKALGNSIALPPWKWTLKRLCACYERDATLGSLFDGIGGFSFLWEQINGKGSCLWASEIEEFCIAVTKKRFGD